MSPLYNVVLLRCSLGFEKRPLLFCHKMVRRHQFSSHGSHCDGPKNLPSVYSVLVYSVSVYSVLVVNSTFS